MSPSALRYEQWVRRRCGGPSDVEFAVRHPDGKEIWFDAAGRRGGAPVLVEAKARYSGFVDPDDDWLPWFRWSSRAGLGALVAQARRQVEAARGVAVEWWCAERIVAELLADEFRASPLLSGRVAASFVPMPGWTPD
jgi:hypothetical protein